MKKILLIIFPVLIFTVAGIAYAISGNMNSKTQGGFMDKKVLVAYFSWSGNTKYLAEQIHTLTGGDMFEIVTQTPYPSNYTETGNFVKKQRDENYYPPLKNNIDVSRYDVIFVGTPAWWHTMAPPVKTFLTENNFNGKTIVPFISHGGGGKYMIAQEMEQLAKGSHVVQTPLLISGRGDSELPSQIQKWLNSIK